MLKKLALAFGFVVMALLSPAQAAQYPTKPIKLVLPYAPGGSSDIAVRLLSKYMGKYLGVEVPVINVTGAAGFAGTLQVFEAKPDGYTLLAQIPTFMTSYHTGVSRFTWDAMTPVSRVQSFSTVVVASNDAPWKDALEMVEYVKANPGKVKWGLNMGAGLHFLALDFANASGTVDKWQYVASGGDEMSVKALLGGHIDVAGSGETLIHQHYKSKTLRVMGALSEERLPALPDVPTFKELGIDSQFVFEISIYGPPNTDSAIVERLDKAFAQISNDPDYLKEMAEQSLYATYLGTEELKRLLLEQDAKFYKFARMAKLIPERK